MSPAYPIPQGVVTTPDLNEDIRRLLRVIEIFGRVPLREVKTGKCTAFYRGQHNSLPPKKGQYSKRCWLYLDNAPVKGGGGGENIPDLLR